MAVSSPSAIVGQVQQYCESLRTFRKLTLNVQLTFKWLYCYFLSNILKWDIIEHPCSDFPAEYAIIGQLIIYSQSLIFNIGLIINLHFAERRHSSYRFDSNGCFHGDINILLLWTKLRLPWNFRRSARAVNVRCRIASMGSGAAASQAMPGVQAKPVNCPPDAPVTPAALADFSKSPPARRTSLDLFSTVCKQPQSIGADSDHAVCALSTINLTC